MNGEHHQSDNESCPWNNPDTFANPATAGLPCTCPTPVSETTPSLSFSPQMYLKFLEEQLPMVDIINRRIHSALDQARKCPLPANLRRMTYKDVRRGQVIWMKDQEDDEPKWLIIEQVHAAKHPSAGFSADGCLYGIGQEFYVEVEPEEVNLDDVLFCDGCGALVQDDATNWHDLPGGLNTFFCPTCERELEEKGKSDGSTTV